MHRIKKITIQNFKFFAGTLELGINRKNLLIFGENGSGKSSIYWALFTFMQSVFKEDDEVHKYFDISHEENLVNKFAPPTESSSITIEYEDDDETIIIKRISSAIVNTKADEFIRRSSVSSEFINYRLLSRIYDFDNSQTIDLFKFFERELFLFIHFNKEIEPGDNNAHSWWCKLKGGLPGRFKMKDEVYTKFQSTIADFNFELSNYLNKIIETTNDYLTKKFKQPLKIKILYANSTFNEFEAGSTTKRTYRIIAPRLILTIEYAHNKLRGNSCDISRPHAFLNEARLTTIALSLRFAILDERYNSSASKLLVLDDLLLSLDMGNRDLVLDVIINNFSDYQKIVLTHDKLLFEIAKHKINKNNERDSWRFIEMYESEYEGIPQPVIIDSESYLQKAKKYHALKEYDISGNFLRKQAESFCKAFLPKKKQFASDFSILDLNGLILQSVIFAQENDLDTLLFEQLDGFRKFVLNPSSHDSFEVPKYSNEILACISTLQSLDKITYTNGVKSGEKLEFELRSALDGDSYKFEIEPKEDLSILTMPNQEQVLMKGNLSIMVSINGTKKKDSPELQNESISRLYSKCYAKSDKVNPASFWDGVILTNSAISLRSILAD